MRFLIRIFVASFAMSAPVSLVARDGPTAGNGDAKAGAVVLTEFIFQQAPFPSCHASTIAETRTGLIAAWFGGTRERSPDVGIWVSRRDKNSWSKLLEVADGIQPDGKRYPCWNPVLFQAERGPLFLFYKVGPSPSEWWGMVITSSDGGSSWSKPRRLPEGIIGPVKNKPVGLKDGSILSGSSTEHAGWLVHMEYSRDMGATWQTSQPLNDRVQFGAIQPTVLVYRSGAIQILCRSRQKRITECWSTDGGKTWSPMKLTSLPNPSAGIDAVMLKDGRALLVYNHTEIARSPLNLAASSDGKLWKAALAIEDQPGEYSYPAVIQTRDGLVHVTYTWKRERIKHVVIDPAKLELRDMPDGRWP
ncbi:MAG TPA: sialidase family protein [Blastocatellia bacterium]|nr:sialidase family protein [Blastocatellia bacterium]